MTGKEEGMIYLLIVLNALDQSFWANFAHISFESL